MYFQNASLAPCWTISLTLQRTWQTQTRQPPLGRLKMPHSKLQPRRLGPLTSTPQLLFHSAWTLLPRSITGERGNYQWERGGNVKGKSVKVNLILQVVVWNWRWYYRWECESEGNITAECVKVRVISQVGVWMWKKYYRWECECEGDNTGRNVKGKEMFIGGV